MRTSTQSITIKATPGNVFAFVADPENLPKWAIGFAKKIRQQIAELGRELVVLKAHLETACPL